MLTSSWLPNDYVIIEYVSAVLSINHGNNLYLIENAWHKSLKKRKYMQVYRKCLDCIYISEHCILHLPNINYSMFLV